VSQEELTASASEVLDLMFEILDADGQPSGAPKMSNSEKVTLYGSWPAHSHHFADDQLPPHLYAG